MTLHHVKHESAPTVEFRRGSGGWVGRRLLILAVACATTVSTAGVAAYASAVQPTVSTKASQPDFGPNVKIFDPSTPTGDIQATLDKASGEQVANQFGSQRNAFLFKPGTYNVDAQLGYYTSVAGLGLSPDDVTINGQVRVEGQKQTDGTYTALNNFWRSAENLSVNPTGGTDWWAVSQASPMRRVDIKGQLNLSPRENGFASGGYLADSKVDGLVLNSSQQQWLTRNSSIGSWSNGVWNQVFSGVQGAPAQSFSATPYNPQPYTTLPTSPATQEKPFLTVDSSDHYGVFVPSLRHDSVGNSWSAGPTAGTSIPIEKFFIAKPTDSVTTINKALAKGQNLLFTPGIYHLDKTITVDRPDTVVLGLGFPTLIPDKGVVPMTIADVKGVKLAGLLFDAGPVNSPVLLQVGSQGKKQVKNAGADPTDPTSIQDVFFRVGGAGPGKATTSLVVNSDNVLLDHIWAWRADHGTGVGWTTNTADTGVIVNGNNVTAYGLFVEHYQKYQLIWNGENGKTIFFQNELPYDAPNQAAWTHNGMNGYAGYKVADSVKTHEAWGLGSYCFFNVDPTIHATRGFEVPNTPGVKLHDVLTVSLGGVGTIDHVVNDTGAAAQGKSTTPVNLVSYPPLPVPVDTSPPTVAITDNVAAVTATGAVTFTFAFSEDIGTSFTTDDIVLSGGTKGAFVRVDATHVTLVATPTANATGTLDISVAASTFSDLAGNANTAAAAAQQAYAPATTTTTQMSLPLTFDSATVDYGFIGFGGAEDSSLAADPTAATNTVAKVVRAAGAETYAGTTITAAAALGFASKIPFTATDTSMSVRVWSPDAGIPVRLKVEDHSDVTKSVEAEVATTVADGWQTLTFDFAHEAAGTEPLHLANSFDKATIFFDFGRAKASAVQKTYYFDDMVFVPGAVTPPPPPAGGVITFDESTPPVLTGFGGAEDSTVVADPANAANKVAKVVKATGAQTWAGTTVSTLANQAIAPIGFSAGNTSATARVWSPDSGIAVRMKVEDAADGTKSVETDATTTVAGGWETLTFNFANQAAGTAALNLATTYNKVSVFFDFGTAGTGKTYYLDDLSLPVASVIVPPPPAAWTLTFDNGAVPYTLTDFGLYGTAGAVVADPAGGANKVAQVFKYAGTSEQWGGTTVSTGANFSVDAIPFTAAKTKMTMRVYSPAAGVRVRMKVENAGNTGINCETDAFTATSGAWETLTFDFGDPSTHYIPNGPTTYNLGLPTASLNVANTYNKVSVFFDFARGSGGYAPMLTDQTYYFDDLSFVS